MLNDKAANYFKTYEGKIFELQQECRKMDYPLDMLYTSENRQLLNDVYDVIISIDNKGLASLKRDYTFFCLDNGDAVLKKRNEALTNIIVEDDVLKDVPCDALSGMQKYISKQCKGRKRIYTDGASRDQTFSCAIYCSSEKEKHSDRWILPNFSTAFAAELMGIYQALKYAESKGYRKIAILTDCNNALLAVKYSARRYEKSAVLNEINDLVSKQSKLNAKVIWIKGHCGIDGNEIADELAKGAFDDKNVKVMSFLPDSKWLPTPLIPENFHKNRNEQKAIKNNLIAYNIPKCYTEKIKPLKKVLEKHLRVKLPTLEIEPWRNNSGNFNFKFGNFEEKIVFLSAFSKKCDGKKITWNTFVDDQLKFNENKTLYFNNALTKYNQDLLKYANELKSEKSIFDAFEHGGKIWIIKKEGNEKVCALSLDHVKTFKDHFKNYARNYPKYYQPSD